MTWQSGRRPYKATRHVSFIVSAMLTKANTPKRGILLHFAFALLLWSRSGQVSTRHKLVSQDEFILLGNLFGSQRVWWKRDWCKAVSSDYLHVLEIESKVQQ